MAAILTTATSKNPPLNGSRKTPGRAGSKRPRCEDCFFHQNLLCALGLVDGCPTFRPAHPDGLRPPQQLSFVFRQERPARIGLQPLHR
jgi:hypothetical protein